MNFISAAAMLYRASAISNNHTAHWQFAHKFLLYSASLQVTKKPQTKLKKCSSNLHDIKQVTNSCVCFVTVSSGSTADQLEISTWVQAVVLSEAVCIHSILPRCESAPYYTHNKAKLYTNSNITYKLSLTTHTMKLHCTQPVL
jgi:hypothetical protein